MSVSITVVRRHANATLQHFGDLTIHALFALLTTSAHSETNVTYPKHDVTYPKHDVSRVDVERLLCSVVVQSVLSILGQELSVKNEHFFSG
jgi:hypothetical protein